MHHTPLNTRSLFGVASEDRIILLATSTGVELGAVSGETSSTAAVLGIRGPAHSSINTKVGSEGADAFRQQPAASSLEATAAVDAGPNEPVC